MSVLNRFRRTSIWSLEVGDVIRFRAYHQSRTGYIVRLRGKGRIEALDRHPAEDPGRDPYIEGRIWSRGNILHGFRLTDGDAVYRQTGARSSAPPTKDREGRGQRGSTDAAYPSDRRPRERAGGEETEPRAGEQ